MIQNIFKIKIEWWTKIETKWNERNKSLFSYFSVISPTWIFFNLFSKEIKWILVQIYVNEHLSPNFNLGLILISIF
jgi:hypothetical protein